VALIESAYRTNLSSEEWLERLMATASAALGSERGAMAFLYDASAGDWVYPQPPVIRGLSPEFARDFLSPGEQSSEERRLLMHQFVAVRFGALRPLLEGSESSPFTPILDRHGIEELVAVNGLDASRRGCLLVIADCKRTHSLRAVHVWHRLSAHISAGNRLRATLEALVRDEANAVDRAEAILAPDGKVAHATGPAEPRSAREALREALVRIDAARSEKDDAGRSVELWRGLVAGRWSLVEHFESDGRRYFLAHKNDPEVRPNFTLTERERQVLGYAELGHSNKLIGYELGLSRSAVTTTLQRARRKLRIE
jgi:DNA-binding NarL/FixJ family response regulator